MNDADLLRLAHAYHEGELDAAGAGTLAAAIRSEGPPFELALDGELAVAFGAADSAAILVAVRSAWPRRRPRPAVRRRRSPTLFVVAAAALAAVLAVALLMPTPAAREPAPATVLGRLAGISGEVGVDRDGRVIAATIDLPLGPGDRVRTGADGNVVLRFADGGSLALGTATVLACIRPDDYRLERGALVVVVPVGHDLRIAAPEAEAELAGAQARMVADGSTRLEVTSGSGSLRRGSESPIAVAAGFAAVAGGSGPIRLASAGVLWSDGFEDLAAWGPDPFAGRTQLVLEPETADVHGGRQAARVRYRSPASGDFLTDCWSVARPIRIPAGASRLRLWVRPLHVGADVRADAGFYLRLRGESQAWETRVDLSGPTGAWRAADLDLRHPARWWRQGAETVSAGCPPVDPAAVTHLVLYADSGDFELIIDDLELVGDGGPP